MLGLIGRKVGMTRFFTEEGLSLPVTLIKVAPHRVVQIKREADEGYDAVQLTFGKGKKRLSLKDLTQSEGVEAQPSLLPSQLRHRSSMVSRPVSGHYKAHGSEEVGEMLKEFRVTKEELKLLEARPELPVALFEHIKKVDVTGTSKGKGYTGVIKRWNFSCQPASHGNSLTTRAPGSIGQNQTPGRVFKGKKMAGRMGAERVTVEGLEVVKVDYERELLVIKGAVPGIRGSLLFIRPASRAQERSLLSQFEDSGV